MSQGKFERPEPQTKTLDGDHLYQTDQRLHYAVVRTNRSIIGVSIQVVQTSDLEAAIREARDELRHNGGQPVVIFKAVRVVRPGEPIVSEVY